MRTRLAMLLAAILLAVAGADPISAQGTSGDAPAVEVRVAAQRLANGSTEFALQQQSGDAAWDERQLPRSRFFPATTWVGRWLASSPLTVSAPGAGEAQVRVAARLLADGRMEFAAQQRGADGEWGERLLPRARFFPANATVGRWLVSTSLTVSLPPLDPAASDKAVLVALYEATDGANWTDSTSWLSDAPLEEWYGVSTDADGRVTALSLWSNGLNGPIPAELGRLTHLQTLDLMDNYLSGPIPPELGSLGNLHLLNLAWNWLGGPIPAEFGGLRNLGELQLSSNQLSGPLPAALGDLSNLYALGLSSNQLSGRIPPEFGRLANLLRLDLSDNQLSGPIPGELGGLSSLRTLTLGGNEIDGCIPAALWGVAESDVGQLGLPVCAAALAVAPASDQEVLVALYEATDGVNWWGQHELAERQAARRVVRRDRRRRRSRQGSLALRQPADRVHSGRARLPERPVRAGSLRQRVEWADPRCVSPDTPIEA